MSSTVQKALKLLDLFSEDTPEIGLSDIARRAGMDKATAHRMLTVMAESGYVEQRGEAKLYRLGAAVLRLARIREAAFPTHAVFQQALDDLSAETGETAHGSLVSGRALATIGISESTKGNRVSLEAGQMLPFHATASGLAALAFSPKDTVDQVLSRPLDPVTPHTIVDPEVVRAELAKIRAQGYSECDQGTEIDVYGIAVPVFDGTGRAMGALAVATPVHRMTKEIRARIIDALRQKSDDVTTGTGGRAPGR